MDNVWWHNGGTPVSYETSPPCKRPVRILIQFSPESASMTCWGRGKTFQLWIMPHRHCFQHKDYIWKVIECCILRSPQSSYCNTVCSAPVWICWSTMYSIICGYGKQRADCRKESSDVLFCGFGENWILLPGAQYITSCSESIKNCFNEVFSVLHVLKMVIGVETGNHDRLSCTDPSSVIRSTFWNFYEPSSPLTTWWTLVDIFVGCEYQV